ncbi:hypothetical protein [Micromonospora sp. NPDC004551]|uniref:hypothetical protein n=1 Tax=Micromonospora sp. NPDC004551 TaxID=3154284 RepID=UPI0033AE80D6
MGTSLSVRLTAVAAALVVAAGCTAPATSPDTSRATPYVVATSGEPDTLNPVLNYGVDGGSLIFDALVARDARESSFFYTDVAVIRRYGSRV